MVAAIAWGLLGSHLVLICWVWHLHGRIADLYGQLSRLQLDLARLKAGASWTVQADSTCVSMVSFAPDSTCVARFD